MNTVKIIGIGDDGAAGLLPQYRAWIAESDVLAGGERQLSFFADAGKETVVLQGGLRAAVEQLQALHSQGRRIVVLASGDPLFYGIGGYLASRLEAEIYPFPSSIQLAFAKLGRAWQDAYVASVHGRSIKGLAQRIDGRETVALLTDETNSPGAVADYLLSFGMKEYRAFVGEHLGGREEQCGWFELEELREREFAPLNVLVLVRKPDAVVPSWTLGIPDEAFAQRKPDKGLITKKEVRVLSLAQMNLKNDSTVWDIGTCTGSVAIEAGRIAREGAVFAIEKNEGDLQNCHDNMRRFRVDLTTAHGRAPEGLEAFQDPDAVFIGGSGGELKELLKVCCGRLKPGGTIVFNAATLENLYEACRAFGELDFTTEVQMVQVSRSKPILNLTRFEALNPIFIITARRSEPASKEDTQHE
ncbi:precorrin-6y C5,15-methyltransferase (decarboxylating) subunit CbiE [Paenibacillus sp. y28]|uniref:precorrin-6y C5,15-methyltransferase (decarboxylating) subunit CbiE n=1 Tax=Paenibacillus sp. y28 TaxID=3129110 RepID=UPI0030195E20